MKRISPRRAAHNPITIATREQYASFVTDTLWPWCWFCGRDESQRPDWWHSPWMMHRAHIVSSPRLEDVRLINLMCPCCHGNEHGTHWAAAPRPKITLANMLWIKERFDPANYAPDFMQRFSVGILPTPEAPHAIYLGEYRCRRPGLVPIANLLAREAV